VLLVWEPVLPSDVAPPLTPVLALVSDPRVAQFWDPARRLSQHMVQAAKNNPGTVPFDGNIDEGDEDLIVWDYVALYPAGTKWEETVPAPRYGNAPVVHYIDELRQHLRGEAPRREPSALPGPSLPPEKRQLPAQPSPG
jgi:hypothetical protein